MSDGDGGAPVSVTDQVSEIGERALAGLPDGEVAAALRTVCDKLSEPLRVAIAGRLKAGKSTLVNALLRQQVARVEVGECTKVVTWFKYGTHERVEVTPRDDRDPWTLNLTPEGLLPSHLGDAPERIEKVTVWLSNETLRSVCLIDTPGLDSLDTASSAATEDLLALGADSHAAVSQADALIFLVPHLSKRDEERLGTFRALFTGTGLSSVSAIGVLSKADKVGDANDPDLTEAHTIARRYQESLRGVVSAVVPLVGLLAETADADVFTESDAEALRLLSRQPAEVRELLLLSPDLFVSDESLPVDAARRERLLEILDLHGLTICLDQAEAGVENASQMLAHLAERSGIGALRELIAARFGRQADALKAHAALSDLERISYLPVDDPAQQAVLRQLRDDVDRVRTAPDMHRLKELEALRALSAGEARLPDDLVVEVERLITADRRAVRLGLSPDAGADECAARALDRASAWLAVENDARTDRPTARVAATVHESFVILWEECTSRTVEPPPGFTPF